MKHKSVVVLASGTGSLLESIIRSSGDGYEVVGVVVDRDCRATTVASDEGVAVEAVIYKEYSNREDWDQALTAAVAKFDADLIVSAGFMRILGSAFLCRFEGSVINTHPALLPSFKGAHAVRDALEYGVKITGSTVHLVDAGVDTGRIIAQVAVPVEPGDTEGSLHERIKVAERDLIVRVLNSSNPCEAQ
ncbi:phosphoribosylglycinamide formyltransferase [Corynebacterium sp. H128]|uniref:phosphoribosylglycinamide formyltransferase n=1 Tax=unclassified Corynebacterium TaxID=2624378 RepID=UPI0030A70992